MRVIYTALIYLLAPFALALSVWSARRDPAYLDRIRERWGYTRARFDGSPLWVHAVSVGEVQAAAPLIRFLQRQYPQRQILVTTGTPTGAQRVRVLFGDSAQHVYLPYDMPGAVQRFLNRAKPAAAIVMETEIWLNLFEGCRRRGIPVILASARLSEKSVRWYRRFPGLVRHALADVIVAAQTDTDAQRFRAIGAEEGNVSVVGNVKFDIDVAPTLRDTGAALRTQQFPGRPVWIAASTHEGEEQIALAAHELICEQIPDALLLLVPRHPQRFEAVSTMLRARAVPFVSRSSSDPVHSATRVLLVDTLGELMMFYACSDVAFVGGSLVPIGGHNLLEPAVLEAAIIVGPHNFNAPEIAETLLANGAACEVNSPEALAHRVALLLRDEAARREMGSRAATFVNSNRGALDRLTARISALIDAK